MTALRKLSLGENPIDDPGLARISHHGHRAAGFGGGEALRAVARQPGSRRGVLWRKNRARTMAGGRFPAFKQ